MMQRTMGETISLIVGGVLLLLGIAALVVASTVFAVTDLYRFACDLGVSSAACARISVNTGFTIAGWVLIVAAVLEVGWTIWQAGAPKYRREPPK